MINDKYPVKSKEKAEFNFFWIKLATIGILTYYVLEMINRVFFFNPDIELPISAINWRIIDSSIYAFSFILLAVQAAFWRENLKAYENRRKALISFKEWLNENLKPYYKNYDFNLPQVILVINEIAKNSADHTDDNAFLGLDIFFNDKEKFIKICFSIGDIGKGINQNIKDNLPENMKERLKYWDLTQMYRVALKRGFTTKQNFHENKGMGMSIILDGAKGIELDLSVFDAKSRGVLSNIHSLSHSEIRKNFFYIGNFVGFYYYGELKAKKIKNEKNFSFR